MATEKENVTVLAWSDGKYVQARPLPKMETAGKSYIVIRCMGSELAWQSRCICMHTVGPYFHMIGNGSGLLADNKSRIVLN